MAAEQGTGGAGPRIVRPPAPKIRGAASATPRNIDPAFYSSLTPEARAVVRQTPVDIGGFMPRNQYQGALGINRMYLLNASQPAPVVTHEWTHAILSRTSGGPSAYSLATPRQRIDARLRYLSAYRPGLERLGGELSWGLGARGRSGEFAAQVVQDANGNYANIPSNLQQAFSGMFNAPTRPQYDPALGYAIPLNPISR